MAKVTKRERLLNVCRNITGGGNVDADAVAAFRKAVLRYADLQHITPDNLYQSDGEVGVAVRGAWDVLDASGVLKELDDTQRSSSTGAAYPRNRWYLDLLRDRGDIDENERDDDDDDNGDDDDVGKADHYASTIADLLVESGRFSDRPAALHHLLHRPGGRALLASLHKAAETENGATMDSIHAIMKDIGPIAVAKQIVTGRAFGMSEATYVEEASRRASEMYGLPGDRAFAKLCETDGDVVRACGVLKAAEFSVYDIKPVVVGGADARDVDNATAAMRAYEEIVRIGREKFPFLSADQQFARIFEDRNYAALAALVHRRPSPTTIYQGPGSATPYTKADPAPHADTAYAELMAKAAEYRKAHPELSEAQAFAVIYSDRSNIELAKRERQEAAAR